MTDRYRPTPGKVANYLYLMILRKDSRASDHADRIEAEVEIIRRLSTKVYKRLRSHRINRLPGETIPKYCKRPK